jgi:hypothetical protein
MASFNMFWTTTLKIGSMLIPNAIHEKSTCHLQVVLPTPKGLLTIVYNHFENKNNL